MSLTGIAIKKSTTVMVMVVFIIIAGLTSYFSLPREATPDVKIPYMIITTVYPGVAPADIENLITRKIEKELKNLKDVKEIASSSSESFSVISVEFDPKVDLNFALQQTKDKVDAAKPDLPEEAEDPVVSEINFENMPIINIILTADYDLVKLKKVADDLSDDFETIQGVLDAKVTGDLEREVKINTDPSRLNQYNLSIMDVAKTVMSEHVTIPGGTIDIGDYNYSVRVPGELKDPYGFKDLVVKATNRGPVYVHDLADVEYGFKDRTTISRLNGKPSITIGVTKRAGENIVRITDEVKKIIKDNESVFPKGTHINIQGDQAKFIEAMVLDLENNIISGFILVVVCIFLFLGLTNSMFIAVSIPLSMLISFVILELMGITLNFMVLFSLIMALGMLVDNAVVIVENIYRHRHHEGKDAARGSEEATNEVLIAVTTSTLTTVAAFVPLLFWPGIMGEFMKYLPITVIVTLSASLFVAIFINPVLCYKYMKVNRDHIDKFESGSGFYQKIIMKNYEKLLKTAVNKPKMTLLISFAVLFLSGVAYGFLGKGIELFPNSDPDSMYINIKGPVGMRLDSTDSIAKQLENTVKEFPDIENIVTNVGVSTSSSGLGGGFDTKNEARIYMDFKDFNKRSQKSLTTFNESVNKVKYITGADVQLKKEDNGPPVGEPVEIQVSGEDYLTLGALAKDIRNQVKNIPGLVSLKDDFESSKPEIVVKVDREKAAVLGINTSEIASAVRNAITGFDAGDFRVEEDDYDITVRFAERFRTEVPDLNRIFIFKDEKQIPLSSVADFSTSAGFGTIHRTDLKRVVTISGTNYGRLANDVLNDVKAKLKTYKLPERYKIKYTGQDQEQTDSAIFLAKALMVALFAIAMILVSQFDSLVIPLIIMSSVILSLIGALWGLMISQIPFGVIMTGVGIISLAGVVVNNAIVLLDYTVKLRHRGMTKYEATVQAGKTRFRPVILTAICTIVGIIPLAIGWSFDFHTFTFAAGGSSAQWWSPMAVVIIYGLAFATILTLVVVPSMYMILGKNDIDFNKSK